MLKSAVANAENNHHMDGDNLKVATAMVDGGPMMKRVRYAPMGRGYRMVKRLSHITIAVEETEPKPEKKAKRKEVARTRQRRQDAAAKRRPAKPKQPQAREAKAEEGRGSEEARASQEEIRRRKRRQRRRVVGTERFTRSDSASGSFVTGRASGMRDKDFPALLLEDAKIRKFVKKHSERGGRLAHVRSSAPRTRSR